MTTPTVRKSRHQPKGRQPDVQALAEVRALIGPRPLEGHRRDLLIEHLHALNDHYRALHRAHLVALAHEMGIPQAEVMEVASFYHHFEILPDGTQAPALTVRVCDGLACDMAGAADLASRLPALLGRDDVRVVTAPCVGRCDTAPVAVVHQTPVPLATAETVLAEANRQLARVKPDTAAIN